MSDVWKQTLDTCPNLVIIATLMRQLLYVGGSLKGTGCAALQSCTEWMGPFSQGLPTSVCRRMPWELHREVGASVLHGPYEDVMITTCFIGILQLHLPVCMCDYVHRWQERGSISLSEALIFLSKPSRRRSTRKCTVLHSDCVFMSYTHTTIEAEQI